MTGPRDGNPKSRGSTDGRRKLLLRLLLLLLLLLHNVQTGSGDYAPSIQRVPEVLSSGITCLVYDAAVHVHF